MFCGLRPGLVFARKTSLLAPTENCIREQYKIIYVPLLRRGTLQWPRPTDPIPPCGNEGMFSSKGCVFRFGLYT